MVEGFFSARSAPTLGNFDAVHLNNVLEHVPNPLRVIRLARGLLAPGGLICLNVPNDFTPFQAGARAALSLPEWWVAPPHHLNYFDFESLSQLIVSQGFEIAERNTSAEGDCQHCADISGESVARGPWRCGSLKTAGLPRRGRQPTEFWRAEP